MIRRLALVLLLAAPLAAEVTPKQAVAAFKQQAKASLKNFKQVVKGRHANFLAEADQNLADYVGGQLGWQSLVYGTFNALESLQTSLQQDLQAAMGAVANAGALALSDVGATGDAFPLDMYFGTGGALDQAIADLHAVVDKELAAARKALKKASKALADGDDVVMLIMLQRPDLNDHYVVTPGKPFAPDSETLAVHTIVTGSARGVAGDGVISIGGRGYEDTLHLGFGGAAGFTDDAEIDSETHTWIWQSGTDAAEGNYVATAVIESDTTALSFNFGVP